jgi:hypothetical protein
MRTSARRQSARGTSPYEIGSRRSRLSVSARTVCPSAACAARDAAGTAIDPLAPLDAACVRARLTDREAFAAHRCGDHARALYRARLACEHAELQLRVDPRGLRPAPRAEPAGPHPAIR